MKFWDSSAIVPLLVREGSSELRRSQLRADPQIIAWWSSRIECASALNRLRRDGVLEQAGLKSALSALAVLAAAWHEVQPTDALRERAMRLLRLHPLRTADALQLAAALIACEENPAALPFVTGDERLAEAAEKEGFQVL